ncbi:MAG: OmpA family protein [Porphyromonadaceae bacterium]|nr:OmpA family protein [Porphyromonadaceae bacterium]
MKSILLASALFSVATLASAQRVEAGQGQPMSSADTLITLTEGELAEAVQRVAAARLAAERSTVTLQSQQQTTLLNSGISAETLRIIKLQMLLQALGLTPGQTPQVGAQTSVQHSYLPYSLPQQAQAPLRDPRVDRLEQLMMLLVQQRQAERNAIVLPGKTSRSTTPASRHNLQPQQVVAQNTSDSLLKVIQSELIALRAQQPQQTQQPQVIIQQIPQAQPQQLAPEVRTDTVVRSIGFKRQVFFAVGQSKLLPEARLTLNEVYRYLSEDPSLQLFLTGYASPEGNAQLNARLSQARSQAVLDYLKSCGISADRLQVVVGGVDHQSDLHSVARRVDIELRK